MKMNELNAMRSLEQGANTGIKDVLTSPLYSTIELKTGIPNYQPFALRKGEAGLTFGDTNVQDGGQVPAKQRWTVHGLTVSVLGKVALTSAIVVKLQEALFNASLRYKQDSSPKFETTLSEILGARTLIQSVDAVGSTTMNSTFAGKMKFKRPLVLSAQTTYEFDLEFLGADIDADLDGVKIRVALDRTLERLV